MRKVRCTSISKQLPPKMQKKLYKSHTTVKVSTTYAASLMISQIVKVEIYIREVRQVILKLLSLTKNEAGASGEACEEENSKFVGTIGLTSNPAARPGVMSWNCTFGLFSSKRTTYIHSRRFPTKWVIGRFLSQRVRACNHSKIKGLPIYRNYNRFKYQKYA